MLIIGKISGIQNYLFDVAAEGGAQAKRLRARSFFMQVLTETLALRTAEALKMDYKSYKNSLVFCNAGKFALESTNVCETFAIEVQKALLSEVNGELLKATTAQLSFSLSVSEIKADSIEADYNQTIRKLNFAKRQVWTNAVTANGVWKIFDLVLDSINVPCVLCRQEKGEVDEYDEALKIIRKICRTCETMREIGKQLTEQRKNWIILSTEKGAKKDFEVGTWSFNFAEKPSSKIDEYSISLDGSENHKLETDDRILSRRLVRSIPKKNNKPIEFVQLAKEAKGDELLGLLKMDADSLGKYINELNKTADSLNPLKKFSQRLDNFFAETLTEKLKNSNIYTVFAGGDDLILVGAWNEVFDFAGELQKAFALNFNKENLTISGGLTIFKPKMPIKNVAAEAEELLSKAKENIIDGEDRNQFAAFGQVWKWKDHEAIINEANKIVRWIEEGSFQRGWLNTLLRLAMIRQENPLSYESRLATARLANFWMRNFKNSEVWEFGKTLFNDFDDMKTIKTKYLAAIARYALTATRSRTKEENE